MIPVPKGQWAMVKFSLVRCHAITIELFKHLQVVIPLMRNQDTALDTRYAAHPASARP